MEKIIWNSNLPSYSYQGEQPKKIDVHTVSMHTPVVSVHTTAHFKEKFFACINIKKLRHQGDVPTMQHFVDLLFHHPIIVPDEGKIGIVYDHESAFHKLKSIHDEHGNKRLWGRVIAKTPDITGAMCHLLEFSILQKTHSEHDRKKAIHILRMYEDPSDAF